MKNSKHQVKAKWYYIFWGAMAVAVVGGQIYVGFGYREMAKASKSSSITVTCVPPYQPPKNSSTENKTLEFE
jgi:hypothetical protein